MKQSKLNVGRWIAAVFVAVGLGGCGDGVLADGEGAVYLTPWNTDAVGVTQMSDHPPRIAPQYREEYEPHRERYEQIASALSERGSGAFDQQQEVRELLGVFEQAYLTTGNYLHLVAMYQEHYRERGVDAVSAPALAWSWIKLGNDPAMDAAVDELIEHRPDDPITWTVVGLYHLRMADDSLQAAKDARNAFERVFELDPDFAGFKELEAEQIRREKRALDRRIPDGEPAVAEGSGVDVPMHHEGGDVEPAQSEAMRADATEAPDEPLPETDVDPEEPTGDIEATDEVDDPEQYAEAGPEDDPSDEADGEADEVEIARELMRGQRALQRGGDDQLQQAESHFERVLELDSDNVDARIGLLRLGARIDVRAADLAPQVDELAERELTARQAYELGLFCLRSLNDRDRATSLLERVREMDPSFARRVGVDSLLEGD